MLLINKLFILFTHEMPQVSTLQRHKGVSQNFAILWLTVAFLGQTKTREKNNVRAKNCAHFLDFWGSYRFFTFSRAASIAPFRSILAGQTKEQVPHCWQYSAPSFFTLAQSPFSTASFIETVGILPAHT